MRPKYLIGTLFDEEQIDKKTNINNIKNKDPMGNTRWQGAFTGGFSAGFKNTCGSKEGWQPAQFVSSVSRRADKKQQKVLDFMDKQDLGRQSISTNIEVNKSFATENKNPFNIVVQQSIGEKILCKLKKSNAFQSAPENQQDLDKLLRYYQHEQSLSSNNKNSSLFSLKDLQKPFSVGATQFTVEDDQFIQNYDQLYKKVIRTTLQQQTEEEKQKRIEQNKVYFDFAKPMEEQPQYLKEIHEIEELEKPKKRRKNLLNTMKLKEIFAEAVQFKQFIRESNIEKAPEDYDPYHRIRNIKDYLYAEKIAEKQQVSIVSKHRIHSIERRSDILGSDKLANRFRSASSTNNFIRGDDKKVEQLKKHFQDKRKNTRYIDYVEELQGRKIACQTQYLSYQQAEKQKQEFQRMYKKQKQLKNKNQAILQQTQKTSTYSRLPKQIEQALSFRNKQDQGKVDITRTVKTWRPQQLLCKRFGCLIPYKIDQNKNQFQKDQQHF